MNYSKGKLEVELNMCSSGDQKKVHKLRLNDARLRLIAEIMTPETTGKMITKEESEANAKRLARGWNNLDTFDALLDACKFALDRFESITGRNKNSGPDQEYSVRTKLEYTIAQAEDGQ